ncbi:MAG: hypothetical protein E4H38_03320, partial [Gemmatimonadales bacterium]
MVRSVSRRECAFLGLRQRHERGRGHRSHLVFRAGAAAAWIPPARGPLAPQGTAAATRPASGAARRLGRPADAGPGNRGGWPADTGGCLGGRDVGHTRRRARRSEIDPGGPRWLVADGEHGGTGSMRLVLAGLVLLAACRGTLSPLSNKVEIGQESYIVFAADGEDGVGDLFASSPGGGTAWQITFGRVDERLPALSPDGVMLAFDRGRLPGDTTTRSVVVMNLLNGAERQVVAPGVLRPSAIAWSADGERI